MLSRKASFFYSAPGLFEFLHEVRVTVKYSPQLEFVIFMVECDLNLDCINGTMLTETVELHGVEQRGSGGYGC